MTQERKKSQLGVTAEAHAILKRLAARGSSDDADAPSEAEKVSAPFSQMVDAFRFALAVGLAHGRKKRGKTRTTFQWETVAKEYDLETLVAAIGMPEDLRDVGMAINEYASWGLLQIQDEMVGEEYRLARLVAGSPSDH